MIENKLVVALSLAATMSLTACGGGGGGGDAGQNVVRLLFAVGDIVDVTEDDGPVEGDVSSNDQAQGLSLTYALAEGSAPENGTLEFNADGTFVYTPNPDFYGEDSVTYVATQTLTGETDTAVLTFNVENDFELLEEYGWSLAWSDEFDGAGVDDSLWMGMNASVEDGNLVITAEEGVTSALNAVNSMTSGRLEARIQIPAGSGLFSAFGLLPMADLYEGENAFTAMESDDDGIIAGAHYGLGLTNGVEFNGTTVTAASSEFQTYAVEWNAEQIRWYVNGTHVHTVDTLNTWAYTLAGEDVVVDQAGPFNQDMQITLQLEANGAELPAEMLVDYVKVWTCDPTVAPGVDACASNVVSRINKAASDRIEAVGSITTDLYTDALQELSWHYTDEVVELAIATWNDPVVEELDTAGEHGVVIDVNHAEGDGNIAITAPGVELVGRDAVLSFDMYIDSAATDSETLDIRMETGWPYMGIFTWNVAELELDTWVTYTIQVADFVNSPFLAPDWIDWIPGVGEGDPLPLDTSDIGSLLTIEFHGGVHFQLDNVALVCTSNESCIQGPLAEQAEETAGGGGTPIRIEAEDYDSESGTQLEATTDDGGGENVGFTDPGDFLEYTINLPADGTYTLNYRLAGQNDSDGFTVTIGGVLVDTQIMPATGGWQEWVTQTGEATLVAGEQTMRIDFVGSQVNINWIELIPPASEIFIEAEDFDDGGEIQLETTTDEGGGENVGFTDPGDFLEYTVNIPADGVYTIEYRLAGQNDSDGFEVSFGGVLVDTQPMPATGGWQEWVTQTGEVTLVAGEQTMRLDFIGGQVNLNWFKIKN